MYWVKASSNIYRIEDLRGRRVVLNYRSLVPLVRQMHVAIPGGLRFLTMGADESKVAELMPGAWVTTITPCSRRSNRSRLRPRIVLIRIMKERSPICATPASGRPPIKKTKTALSRARSRLTRGVHQERRRIMPATALYRYPARLGKHIDALTAAMPA